MASQEFSLDRENEETAERANIKDRKRSCFAADTNDRQIERSPKAERKEERRGRESVVCIRSLPLVIE